MVWKTKRLILRPWKEQDAESLYRYAKDPEIGPIAGWMPHKDRAESLMVIQQVLQGEECYAICKKEDDIAIGAIELKGYGHSPMVQNENEGEIGFWIGKPFWGNGYMPEAVQELLRHGFEDLGMQKIWCGYYDGNVKSRRVQEKVGFIFHHTCVEYPVPLMQEVRICHINCLTKQQWLASLFSNKDGLIERE